MAWEGCYGAGVTVQVLRCRCYGAGVARCRWYGAGVAGAGVTVQVLWAGVTVQVLRCRCCRCGARGAVMRDELELCCDVTKNPELMRGQKVSYGFKNVYEGFFLLLTTTLFR